MRKVWSVALVTVVMVGCPKKEPPAPEAPEGPAASASARPKNAEPKAEEAAAAPSGSVAPKKVVDDRTIHAFAGTVGKDHKLRLYLERKGDELTGLYQPEGSVTTVPVKGTVKADDKFVLEELDDKGKVLGTYDGWFKNGLLKGTYTDAKTKKPRVFVTEALRFGDEPFTTSYTGALGGKLRIRAKLERKGKALSGVYRYAKSKENLVLTGTVDAEGDVVLEETTKSGKTTGRIEGVLMAPGLLVGRWSSPDKTRSLSLLIEQSDAYPEIVELGGGVKVVPQEDYKEASKNCSSSLLFPSIEGAKGKAALHTAIRKEGDGHLDKSSCEGASAETPYVVETTYTVQKSKLPWFGLSFHTYSSTGGAHPSWWGSCKVANADTGELFALASKMSPEARKKLSALVMARLKKEHGVENLSEAGFFEDEIVIGEKTNVCPSAKGGLVVEFNPYEVTPWVMGAPTVEVTSEEARPLLPDDLAVLVR
jgi:hypothetical protein